MEDLRTDIEKLQVWKDKAKPVTEEQLNTIIKDMREKIDKIEDLKVWAMFLKILVTGGFMLFLIQFIIWLVTKSWD